MSASRKDREEFIATVTQCGCSLDDARAILRDAATHQRICTEECNREVTTKEQRRCDAAAQRIIKRAATFGAKAKFGGDPRGYTVKLLLPNGRYNTWGGDSEGWGVPA